VGRKAYRRGSSAATPYKAFHAIAAARVTSR